MQYKGMRSSGKLGFAKACFATEEIGQLSRDFPDELNHVILTLFSRSFQLTRNFA